MEDIDVQNQPSFMDMLTDRHKKHQSLPLFIVIPDHNKNIFDNLNKFLETVAQWANSVNNLDYINFCKDALMLLDSTSRGIPTNEQIFKVRKIAMELGLMTWIDWYDSYLYDYNGDNGDEDDNGDNGDE